MTEFDRDAIRRVDRPAAFPAQIGTGEFESQLARRHGGELDLRVVVLLRDGSKRRLERGAAIVRDGHPTDVPTRCRPTKLVDRSIRKLAAAMHDKLIDEARKVQ